MIEAAGTREAAVAAGRAAVYELFVSVWERLPDRILLDRIKNGDFPGLLSGFGGLRDKGFRRGLDAISAYGSTIRKRAAKEVLEEPLGRPDEDTQRNGPSRRETSLRGPLHEHKEVRGNSVLEVQRFYRKAGLVPDEAVPEPADYLCVELDFMRQLCLREGDRRLTGERCLGHHCP